MDGWNTILSFWDLFAYFQVLCHVSFREGIKWHFPCEPSFHKSLITHYKQSGQGIPLNSKIPWTSMGWKMNFPKLGLYLFEGLYIICVSFRECIINKPWMFFFLKDLQCEQRPKPPWLVELYRGWHIPQLDTDYFRSHEVRIPINQHFMESQLITAQFLKATPRTGCFFFWFLGIESI